MALNLHLLRIFVTVAEEGSFSKAARATHISQPAVSKGVQELEKQVGLPLLERGARGVRLTEVGTRLLERARAIFAAESAAEEELRAYHGMTSGTLRIGASLTIANYYLPPVLARFHETYPDLELRLAAQNTENIAKLLLEYKVDIALVEGPVHDERIEVQHWREDELVIVASCSHALANRRKLQIKDLNDAIWVVREKGSGTREVVDDLLLKKGVKLKHTVEINSTAAIKQTVAESSWLAMVSRHSAADQIAVGKLVVLPVFDLAVARPLTMLHLKGRQPSVAARAFERFLTAQD